MENERFIVPEQPVRRSGMSDGREQAEGIQELELKDGQQVRLVTGMTGFQEFDQEQVEIFDRSALFRETEEKPDSLLRRRKDLRVRPGQRMRMETLRCGNAVADR